MTTISPPETFAGAFWTGSTFATVDVAPAGDGLCSRWWISQAQTYSVQAIAYLEIPIFGFTMEQARKRIGMIQGNGLLETVDLMYGGTGTISTKAPPYHLERHVEFHDKQFRGFSKTNKTVILYDLLKQLGDRRPAVTLQKLEGLPSSRTIHERLAEHKKSVETLDTVDVES